MSELKDSLTQVQEMMKKYANTKRREVQFVPSDVVFLKLQPYRFRNLTKRPNEKLSPKFYRPHTIPEKNSAVACVSHWSIGDST